MSPRGPENRKSTATASRGSRLASAWAAARGKRKATPLRAPRGNSVGSAADLAALVAVNDRDDAELARSGRLVPSADAVDVARSVFAQNLEPFAALLDATPDEIASAADVRVDMAPATVHITALVPVRTPLFGALFFHPISDVAVAANGGAR